MTLPRCSKGYDKERLQIFLNSDLSSVETVQFEEHAEDCPFCGPQLKALVFSSPLPGTLFDGTPEPLAALPAKVDSYQVEARIGRGGMGVVYRARGADQLPVAIKFAHGPQQLRPQIRARFRHSEAVVIEYLAHPNVVRVYATGMHGDVPYLVMEYCPGGTLAKRLREEAPIPSLEAARLLERIARGVAWAHRREVVHRDLKPANILFDSSGEPKVSDFGLASWSAAAVMQNGGEGTPHYRAPEQTQGKPAQPTADVWSLGLILYECVTGNQPLLGAAVSPTRGRKCVPGDLGRIVAKCLQEDTEWRYQTAAELADDLARFCQGEPVQARPPTRRERFILQIRKQPERAVAAGLILLCVVLVFGVVAVSWLWQETKESKKTEEVARERAERLLISETALREQLAEAEYILTIDLAKRERTENNLSGARKLLSSCPPERRGWEWHFLNASCDRVERASGGPAVPVSELFASADGRSLTAGGVDGTISVRDLDSGRETNAVSRSIAGGPFKFAASADRRWLVRVPGSWDRPKAVTPGRPAIWDLNTRTAMTFPGTAVGRYTAVAVSPDGTHFATADDQNRIAAWDIATGQMVSLDQEDASVAALAYSPDGAWLASATTEWAEAQKTYVAGKVTVRESATGRRVCDCRGPGLGILTLAFTPDGKRLAGAGADRDVFMWAVPAGDAPVRQFRASVGFIGCLGFSTDGRRLAVGSGFWDESKDGGRWVEGRVTVWEPDAKKLIACFRGHRTEVTRVSFTPDNQHVVSGGEDGSLCVWDVPVRPERASFAAHGGYAVAVPSPDGQRVASGGEDGVVRLWDSATARPLFESPDHEAAVTAVAYQSDGRGFATAAKNGTVILRDADGRGTARLEGLRQSVWGLRFSPDGVLLAAGGTDQAVLVWNRVTGAAVRLDGFREKVLTLDFHPAGNLVVTGTKDGDVRIWDANLGTVVRVLPKKAKRINAVAFSPGGAVLATAGDDQVVRLWDAATGSLLRELSGHESWVWSVAFTPDGQRIVTAGADDTVRVWSTQTGREVFALLGTHSRVWRLALNRDGTLLATSTEDGVVQTWFTR